MKKRNLKLLRLNKKSISDLNPKDIKGGRLDAPSLAQCSEVMSCITYTQNNQTCRWCLSVHVCISVQICNPD